MKNHYDFLIVGAGLFGAVCAHELAKEGKSVLVLEKRSHIGGNIYTEKADGIDIHRYGAHIFHTSNKAIWDYVNDITPLLPFINSPVANYKGEIYSMPFNMHTFSKMWGISMPDEAERIIEEQRKEIKGEAENLEQQAISLVGRDIYERLVKGYTEKQWGRSCQELPADIIKRLPVRLTYDNNYFNDRYQGIPEEGYTALAQKLLKDADVILNEDFNKDRKRWRAMADKTIYTGCLDEFYDRCYGPLSYRSEKFETEKLEKENYQGVAVMNFTDREIPYTRIIEHKHFTKAKSPVTWISREYPVDYTETGEPYYPINDEKNNALYERYRSLAEKDGWLFLGGRLAMYKYLDMDKTIEKALDLVQMCK